MGLMSTPCLQAALNKGKLDEAVALIEKTVQQWTGESCGAPRPPGIVYLQPRVWRGEGSDSIFLIASITKPMTTAGVMILADRGQLSLDDPLHKFIPEFTEGDRKLITSVICSLTLRSARPAPRMWSSAGATRHLRILSKALRTPLLFKPGTQVKYQSMGILLAAEAAERITKTPFPQFLENGTVPAPR
jgi:beta-lactamase class C